MLLSNMLRILPPPFFSTHPVVETAQADPELRALVDAVVAGGLVQTLSGPGPFTVFAPIDQAFGALGDNILGKFI